MIGILALYALVTIIVAIMATVDLFRPVFSKHTDMPKDLQVIYYITSFLIAMLFAPLMVYPCVSTEANFKFREAFEEAVFDKA
jgi:hypothetical protein